MSKAFAKDLLSITKVTLWFAKTLHSVKKVAVAWFASTLKFCVSSRIFLFLLTCFIERNAFVLEWSAFYRKNLLIEKYFISYMIISLKLFRVIWNWYTDICIQCFFTLSHNLFTNVNPLLTKSIKLNPWTDLKGVRIF